MSAKCVVCDYEIADTQVEVRVGDHVIAVCCQECADKVREQPEAYAPKK
jgi:hypothetical protein